METEGLSFPEAVERLAGEAGVSTHLNATHIKERPVEGFYADMPEDPELAFLYLEKVFREECEQRQRERGSEEYSAEEYIEYMSRTLAAKTEWGLSALDDWSAPNAEHFSIQVYQDFRRDVEHVRTILQIRHARRARKESVKFDDAAKRRLRHHLQQIRELVDRLELGPEKRDALYVRVSDLEKEIDRERTRFEILGAFVVGFGGIVGEASDKAGLNRLLGSIARVFWGARQQEETQQIPAPPERKRIEPPQGHTRRHRPTASSAEQLDDEIPF
jgi:hypothetical protein